MNNKKFISTIGIAALLLGIGMNVHNALNDYGIKEASLSAFIQAQGTTSSTIFRCDQKPNISGKTSREDMDYTERALLMEDCVIKGSGWNGSVGGSVTGGSASAGKTGKEYGNQCSCKKVDKDFNKNNLGCNAEWETNCI